MTTESPPAPASTPAQPAPAPEVTPAPEATATAPVTETPNNSAATPVVTDNRPPTEAPPPESKPSPIGPDGKLGENWFLALGDEFAPHAKDLAKHKDMRSILTELDYFRKNGVEYPGEGAAAQAVERFRKVAGVPDTPEGYGITPENIQLPDGLEFDSELAEVITQAAHKTHAPPAAVNAIVGAFNDLLAKRTADVHAAHAAMIKDGQDALVAEWRGDFQANISTVRHMTGKLAEQAGILPDDPAIANLANQPAFARIIMQVAKLTAEDRIVPPNGYRDMKSAAQKIADIKSGVDPTWGKKWTEGTREEKEAAYEYVKSLRPQMDQ